MGNKRAIKEIFSDRSTPVMFLAPIEPITANPIIRELSALQGAEIVCRPKIIPQHLLKARQWQYYQKIKGIRKLTTNSGKPVYDGIQLLAKPEDPLGPAIKFINQNVARLGVSFIDLNFGCPGHKVRPQKRGGELLQFPELILDVIEKSLKFAEIPISLKIRKGYSKNDTSLKLLETIYKEFGENIAWITLNRAPVKMGDVITKEVLNDIEIFNLSQQAVDFKIPIIPNGGIRTSNDIKSIISTTECPGIMIGRAALGSPTVFNYNQQIKKDTSNEIGELLNELFRVLKRYQRGNSGRWCTIGTIKQIMYYYMKSYYSTIGEQLPHGFGFSNWNKSHLTPRELKAKLANIFPTIPISQFNIWLEFLH